MRRRGLAGPLLWPVVLAGAALALQQSGRGALAPPPLAHPGQWAGWLLRREPVAAAFSLLRLVGLGALWYLVAVTVVGVVLRLVGAARLVTAADRLTVAPVRRLLAGISLGLAATTVATVAGPATLLPVAVASQPAPTTTTTTTLARPGSDPPATVTMHLLSPAELAPAAAAPAPSAQTVPPAASAAGHWTVRPGECFWTIAEAVLTREWGRAPTDAEIVPYWHRLIDVNRAVLAHPGDPDLVFPGQVFAIPAP
jgi:hypothetical protein